MDRVGKVLGLRFVAVFTCLTADVIRRLGRRTDRSWFGVLGFYRLRVPRQSQPKHQAQDCSTNQQ